LELPGRSSVEGVKTREGYTGHELDEETGLNYAGARFYDPAIGIGLCRIRSHQNIQGTLRTTMY
jgi:hypothetical protein